MGLLYNRRAQRFAIQAAFLVALGLLAVYVVSRATRLDLGFDYLQGPGGFALGNQFLTDYQSSQQRWDAYMVGVWNTVRIVFVGIAMATLLGLVGGVARLSSNWLVSRLATVYVEIVRNTPLLVQIIFWYSAILLARLPKIDDEVNLFGVVWISNRALALPWPEPRGDLALALDARVFHADVSVFFLGWLGLMAVAVMAATLVRRLRIRHEERTGEPGRGNRFALATFLGIAGVAYLVTAMPVGIDTPDLITPDRGAQDYIGGVKVTPEFAALLIGLVVYTGAFITEIVRGSIQALPRGQSEAAMALGLNAYQRLTLVVLPQALRTMIPALTNQYLNLTKNSSLAVVIAYTELFFVGNVVINNAGHAVPMFIVIIGTYMSLSLLIAGVMSQLNRRVQLVGH